MDIEIKVEDVEEGYPQRMRESRMRNVLFILIFCGLGLALLGGNSWPLWLCVFVLLVVSTDYMSYFRHRYFIERFAVLGSMVEIEFNDGEEKGRWSGSLSDFQAVKKRSYGLKRVAYVSITQGSNTIRQFAMHGWTEEKLDQVVYDLTGRP